MKRLSLLLLAAVLLSAPLLVAPGIASAQVSVGISVHIGPPPLPVYPQPFAPGPGFIWTPGYWAWGPYGYYWVPGTWVLAPRVGFLWTPGYWGWSAGMYWWHPGYWGPHIGFYGGINYGYGYIGVGYVGGYWRGGAFYYNRAVTNVNVTYVHNTYSQTVVNNATMNRVSYNGGTGGTEARPTAEQQTYAREQHVAPTAAQVHQERVAMNNPAQRFSANHGRPQIAATAKPGVFKGPGVVRMNAKGNYAMHPAPRDRAVYQAQHRAETRAERPQEFYPQNPQRRAHGQPHPQKQQPRNQHPKQRPCCGMPG
ncbi:MAG: YXWGXW repeat-containing protein [Gammaproteobacteria bacterium]|nr:YXWGXW repeat-containing protein [Gammaproteobacteria bacterium]